MKESCVFVFNFNWEALQLLKYFHSEHWGPRGILSMNISPFGDTKQQKQKLSKSLSFYFSNSCFYMDSSLVYKIVWNCKNFSAELFSVWWSPTPLWKFQYHPCPRKILLTLARHPPQRFCLFRVPHPEMVRSHTWSCWGTLRQCWDSNQCLSHSQTLLPNCNQTP